MEGVEPQFIRDKNRMRTFFGQKSDSECHSRHFLHVTNNILRASWGDGCTCGCGCDCGCRRRRSTRFMSCSAAAAAASAAATRIFSARVGPRGGCRAAAAAAAEAPSCLFVGPIGTASKERLEALYNQARDAYYSGKPLIVDDMFDKVELKLRLYGSKSVVKYPRCSLRRQSTYADAEEDPSQVFALASVWILLLSFGISAFLLPIIYTIGLAFKEAFDLRDLFNIGESSFELRRIMNGIIIIGFGCSIGYPVSAASVQALQGLWRNDLVALKGSCPNCGEEVFAFARAEKSNVLPHSAECHVCESELEFRTKVEASISRPGSRWVYGRVYLVGDVYTKRRRR